MERVWRAREASNFLGDSIRGSAEMNFASVGLGIGALVMGHKLFRIPFA